MRRAMGFNLRRPPPSGRFRQLGNAIFVPRCKSSGSLAMLAAILRAWSLVSNSPPISDRVRPRTR